MRSCCALLICGLAVGMLACGQEESTPIPSAPAEGVYLGPSKVAPGIPYHLRPSEAALDRLAVDLPGFGGMYSDPSGNLHVYISDSSPRETVERAISEYLTGLNRPQRSVIVEIGQYEFQQLRSWQPSIDALLAMSGVLSTDLDEASNRLRIGVANAVTIESVRGALAAASIPQEAVIVQVEEPTVPLTTLSDSLRPLRGGNGIINNASQPCTMGFNAFDGQGRRVFYTASHCSGNMGQMAGLSFYQPSWQPAHFVGVEVSDPPFWNCPGIPDRVCRWGDSAAVEFDDPADFDLGKIHKTMFRHQTQGSKDINSQDPFFTIVEWTGYPIGPEVGQLVLNKMGRTTGWTNGHLIAVCFNHKVFFNGVDTGRTLLCQDKVGAGAQTGDSGSPVFRKIGNNTADLYGMVHSREGDSRFIFSSMWNITADIPFQSVH